MTGAKKWLTWLLRLIVGGTFIFSGFVKAIDPWGTLYKLQDYMAAMHLPDYPNLLLVAAFLLFGYEFCVGVFLLLGCFRRSAPVCAALFMGVMLPLTLWIAVWDPVADCGCFGDFIHISNWATFWKNVVLSAAVIWLLAYNHKVKWLIRPHLQWIAFILSGLYVIFIGLCGYIYQPLLDFRPYPRGSLLVEHDSADDEEGEDADDETENISLIYSRNGVEKAFSIYDELPSEEEGWVFVRREIEESDDSGNDQPTAAAENPVDASDSESQSTFRVWSDDGEEDITDDVILRHGSQLILFMPELRLVSVATTWQINSLYTWASRHEIDMIAVVSGTPEEIAEWRDLSLAAYPLYTAEDTEIKMVVRGNPAVVYLQDGHVVWKTTLRALGTEDFLSPTASPDPAAYRRNNHALLYNSTMLYIILLAVLAFASHITMLGRFFRMPQMRRFSMERDDEAGEPRMTDTGAEKKSEISRDDRGDHSESTPRDTPAP